MANGTILCDADGSLQAKVEWSSKSNGSSKNTSLVTATVYARRTDKYTTKGRSWSGYVAIGGEHTHIDFSSSVEVGSDWVEMASGERTVTHNDDGTKQITIEGSVTGPSGTGLADNTSYGSKDVWLDTIPRYATIKSFTAVRNSETQISVDYEVSETCNKFWYSTDGGKTWSNPTSGDFVSGGTMIGGLSANTKYNIQICVRNKNSGLDTYSEIIPVTTYSYPYITSVQRSELIVGQSQRITLYNPLSRSVNIRMYKKNTAGSRIYVTNSTTSTSITFTPTEDNIYAVIPDEQSCKCIYTVYLGETYVSQIDNNYSVKIKGTEAPTFQNFTYADTNDKTLGLTGNPQIIVKGYSDIEATISNENQASPNKGSSMKSYTLSVGSKSQTKDFTGSKLFLKVYNADSALITVSAKDSRQLSTSVEKNIGTNFKNYSGVVVKSVSAIRENNGVGKRVFVSYNGTYWNGNFGKEVNTIKVSKYWYKESNTSTWITGKTTLPTLTLDGSKWSGSSYVRGDLDGDEGFDITKTYEFCIRIEDELSIRDYYVTIPSGTPAIAIYKGNVAFGQKYDTSGGERVQINGDLKTNGHIKLGKNKNIILSNSYGIVGTLADGTQDYMMYMNSNNKIALSYNDRDILLQGNVLLNGYKIGGYTMNAAAEKGIKDATSSTDSGWTSHSYASSVVPTLNLLSNWNGAWDSNGNSSLKYAYQGIIQCKPTVLYENGTSGTSGTVTLSSSAANFNYIKIYIADDANVYSETTVYSPNGKIVNLQTISIRRRKFM